MGIGQWHICGTSIGLSVGIGQWHLCGTSIGLSGGGDRAVTSLWYLYWSIRGDRAVATYTSIGLSGGDRAVASLWYLYWSIGGEIGQWHLCGTSIGLSGRR